MSAARTYGFAGGDCRAGHGLPVEVDEVERGRVEPSQQGRSLWSGAPIVAISRGGLPAGAAVVGLIVRLSHRRLSRVRVSRVRFFCQENPMAVPRKKVSRMKRGHRRSADALTAPLYVEDKDTGERRRPHHIDLKSGKYRGRQILEPKPEV